jgi:hypothetical protein
MMFLLVWLVSSSGFCILSLGMARHRASLQLSPLTNKQEKRYLWVGLTILTGSLILTFFVFPKAEAIPIWFGLLSVAALKIVGYLSYINLTMNKRNIRN